ncbi:MAG: non-canonical purine NTP diphosphatase [Prevotella sp.]|nr:non-canonical purine NTP diphosphatase [Prevotella sp.]MDY5684968.1 non-canonical purine NTP diphosphatase [Prevotella sp.]
MRIVFATNNAHKLEEIRAILGHSHDILSLNDIQCHADIPETADTLEGNALQKARYVWDHYHLSVFADDTGLEVNALGGAPGVYSARYAGGAGHDSEANMAKLLRELHGHTDRTARFRTVIALILADGSDKGFSEHLFEGKVEGRIATERQGSEGFGYDPLFVPDGYGESFAQLGTAIKNRISHRAHAVARLTDFLSKV